MASAAYQPRPSQTEYPTPPPTSSPKQRADDYQFSSNTKGAATGYYNSSFEPQVNAPYPPADIHRQSSQAQQQSYTSTKGSYEALASVLPGQAPNSSLQNGNLPNGALPNGYSPPRSGTPTRSKVSRPDSPLAYSNSEDPPRVPSPRVYYRPAGRALSPLHRTGSPLSPYNASRPKPRAGLQRSFLDRCTSFGRWLLDLGKKFPILAGLATFLPIILGALGYRAYRRMGGDKGNKGNSIMAKLFGVFGGGSVGGGAAKKGIGEHLFQDFRGFGGAKAEKGMFHGIIKMLQLLV